MMVLWIVLPMALVLAGVGLWAFLWSVRSGQFDDLETPGVRVLIEDDGVLRTSGVISDESGRAVRAGTGNLHERNERTDYKG